MSGRLTILLSLLLAVGGAACRRNETPPVSGVAPPRVVADPYADADRDGIPDGAELRSANERENFRTWFTHIAEQQFYEPSAAWNTEQRDCAGLVRFAWREALRRHDRAWWQRMGAGYQQVAPDVKYDLASGVLGEKLFRTRDGAFQPDDPGNGAFNEFADANTLRQFNATFLGRDVRQAKPGDLLFYFQAFTQKYPYHVMIFLGPARVDNEGADDWLVYHTGGGATDKGEVRKVRVATLAQHPNPRWRPVAHNAHWLGFFRLRILQ
jgi:uncharacterized protein YfaT (DUF1175 family)